MSPLLARRTAVTAPSRTVQVIGAHGADEVNAVEPERGISTRYTGVSDTTVMRLNKANILAAEQIAPYAPLEIKRTDLDSELVSRIVKHLKATGKLVLNGDPSVEQTSLF